MINLNPFKPRKTAARTPVEGKVFLHLGAHKTGSTHLQGIFKLHRRPLEKSGVFYLPLKQIRETFTSPCLQGKIASPEKGTAFFEQAFRECDRVLISDENILGVIDTLLTGHFYPRMPRNIERIRTMAGPDRNLCIYCCVRNYADWIESAYLQILKRKIIPFEKFLRRIDLDTISWPLFIRDLLAAAGDRTTLTLWTYETYCADSERIVSEIGQDLGVTFPDKLETRPNPSISEVAMKMLLAANKQIRPADLPKVYRFLRSNLSTNENYAKPRLIEPDLRSTLEANYRRDLKTLRKTPGVRMIEADRS